MTECIHGLEGQQCDVCFPTKQPERPAAARVAAPRRTSEVRAPRASVAVRKRRPITEERVYYVTHVSNLPGIVADGGVRADATPEVPLLSELGLELQRTAEVAPGRTADEFVPFALTPDSRSWLELRAGAHEPGWSAAARRSQPADYVFLISTLGALSEAIITDGDPAGSLTRFASTPDDVRRVLDRLSDDPELRAGAAALIDSDVPLSAIQLIGVANEPAKEKVRALLEGSGFRPRIAVYPPWFAVE